MGAVARTATELERLLQQSIMIASTWMIQTTPRRPNNAPSHAASCHDRKAQAGGSD